MLDGASGFTQIAYKPLLVIVVSATFYVFQDLFQHLSCTSSLVFEFQSLVLLFA